MAALVEEKTAMDSKDLALILSPIVAVLIAVGTIAFNYIDRKRHYAIESEKLKIEREKLSNDIVKAMLTGAKSLERRIELNNQLMGSISSITAYAQIALASHDARSLVWEANLISNQLEALLLEARSNQTFTSQFIHEEITRKYVVRVTELSARILLELASRKAEETKMSSAKNLLQQVVAAGDHLKELIRDDLEVFVRGVGAIGQSDEQMPILPRAE
jgi:hypothetical protein